MCRILQRSRRFDNGSQTKTKQKKQLLFVSLFGPKSENLKKKKKTNDTIIPCKVVLIFILRFDFFKCTALCFYFFVFALDFLFEQLICPSIYLQLYIYFMTDICIDYILYCWEQHIVNWTNREMRRKKTASQKNSNKELYCIITNGYINSLFSLCCMMYVICCPCILYINYALRNIFLLLFVQSSLLFSPFILLYDVWSMHLIYIAIPNYPLPLSFCS
jgi:hypothetical protein